MIDTTRETLLTLAQAAKAIPAIDGRRLHVSSLWRWARKGLNGTRLDYVRVGRRVLTSRESLDRFFNAVAAADQVTYVPRLAETPKIRTAKQREVAIAAAKARLHAEGV